MMRRSLRRLSPLLLTTISITFTLFLLVAGCRTKAPGDNTLHLALEDNVRTLDPSLVDDTVSAKVLAQIYETPMQYRYEGDSIDKLEPLLLAAEPEIDAAGTTYRLKFRPNIRYQDDPCFTTTQGKGRAFGADDVRLALHRLLDPASRAGGFWTFAGRFEGDEDFLRAVKTTAFNDWKSRIQLYEEHPIAGIKTIDSLTLELKLRAPYPLLPFVLAMPFTAPISHEALTYYGAEFGNHPVGTGPYKLHESHRNLNVVLKRNPAYWGATPAIDTVRFDIIVESQPGWLKFMNGELDISPIPKDNYADAVSTDKTLSPELTKRGIRLLTSVQPTIWYIGFNMNDPLLANDPELRAAVGLAYDSEQRIAVMTNNRAIRATTILPPGIPGFEETSVPAPARDLAKAKELLSKSRYAAMENPPTLHFDLRGNSTTQRQWAEFFKRDMDALGIKTQVQLNSFPEYLDKEKTGRLQIFMGGWIADYPDAENFLQLLYGPNRPPGQNATSFNDAEFNRLFAQLQQTIDHKARIELIKQLVQIVVTQKPWIADFYSTRYELVQPWIKNYRQHPFNYNFIKYLKISR